MRCKNVRCPGCPTHQRAIAHCKKSLLYLKIINYIEKSILEIIETLIECILKYFYKCFDVF